MTRRPRSQLECATRSSWRRILFACSALAAAVPVAGSGQDETIIDPLASVLAAEDARRFDLPLFRAATRHPSPIVRRHAALAMGRIGSPAALSALVELTSDPDTTVRHAAVFGLGILGDAGGLRRIRELALADQGREGGSHAAAVAAAARIGGAEGARVVDEVLSRWVGLATSADLPATVVRALRESWRLGDDAPVSLVSQFAESRNVEVRRAAVYSLGRLRVHVAAGVLLRATEDRDPLVRSYAVRALDAAYADSARIGRGALAARVQRLVADADAGVRVNALRALGSYGGRDHVSAVADRTADSDPNVRVQALAALGQFEGPAAADALTEQLTGGLFATRRQALLSLARVDGAAAAPVAGEWAGAADWRVRSVAAEAYGVMGGEAVRPLRVLARDADVRVAGAAVPHLLRLDSARAESLAVAFAGHDDAVVRATAFRHLGRHPDTIHVGVLAEGFDRARRDRHPAARLAAVRALGAIAAKGGAALSAVELQFLRRYPENPDHRTRTAAQTSFPAAAERWGAARPIETGKGIEDYRDLARELVLPAERGTFRPRIVIETDRGSLVVDLLPATAPLTVQAILDLVDRRYFDGSVWHRVVPNFVVQDGDARGDGRGSPGFSIRDEVSPLGYDVGTVGMARGGPDTGGSQFFITLSPQPHLEGSYTVFGVVSDGRDALGRITLGDRIRRIRRQ